MTLFDLIPILVAIVLYIFVAIPLIDHGCVYFGYGGAAYREGLRIADSKHGILSNGQKLEKGLEIIRTICFVCAFFITFIPALALTGFLWSRKIERRDHSQ